MSQGLRISTGNTSEILSADERHEGDGAEVMAWQRLENTRAHSGSGDDTVARIEERASQSDFISRLPVSLQQPAYFLRSLSRVVTRTRSPYEDSAAGAEWGCKSSATQDSGDSDVSTEASTASDHLPYANAQQVPSHDPASRLSSSLGSSSGPALVGLAVGCTVWWGWRSVRVLERALERRYADIAYQIRRPDSLSNRIVAFKYLVGGGLAIPLAALGACAYLSFNKKASRELLSSRQPQINSSHQADELSGDFSSVAPSISSSDCGEPVRPATIPSATLGAPAGVSILPVRWQFAVKEKLNLFSQGFRNFVFGVVPEREAWQRWASAARRGQAETLRPPPSPFRGGSPD
ncbi:transmembrane protein [Cystoisospora suis]|uniref:Transmembrane protein n=1 Tax=Cystoisospora suis TaxID=483139 RepID=A0A2C6L8V7_9APIC|nr:transmembrane protein [Cystoisospora suis]